MRLEDEPVPGGDRDRPERLVARRHADLPARGPEAHAVMAEHGRVAVLRIERARC